MLLPKPRGLPGDPLIGGCLTDGRPGFVGDVLNDWSFKPAGERPAERHRARPLRRSDQPARQRPDPVPDSRSHSQRQDGAGRTVAEATTVTWPAEEPATVVKFDVFRKKVSIYTGQVLDGNKLFVDFPNCICRNKMVVQFDRPDQCYLLPSSAKEGAFAAGGAVGAATRSRSTATCANRSRSSPR